MKYRMRVSVPATFAFLFAFGVANVCAPSAAAAKIYNVGIYYDVTPSWPDPPCPIHIRFHAEVGANLPPGKSREIVYHWETGKGRVYASHTLTIPPDETSANPPFRQTHPRSQTRRRRFRAAASNHRMVSIFTKRIRFATTSSSSSRARSTK